MIAIPSPKAGDTTRTRVVVIGEVETLWWGELQQTLERVGYAPRVVEIGGLEFNSMLESAQDTFEELEDWVEFYESQIRPALTAEIFGDEQVFERFEWGDSGYAHVYSYARELERSFRSLKDLGLGEERLDEMLLDKMSHVTVLPASKAALNIPASSSAGVFFVVTTEVQVQLQSFAIKTGWPLSRWFAQTLGHHESAMNHWLVASGRGAFEIREDFDALPEVAKVHADVVRSA